MPSALLFLELALTISFLSFSNGAPPEKKIPYSRAEEEFILQEMASNASLYNRNKWKRLAEAHRNKVKDKAPGFVKERTVKALRSHFGAITKNKNFNVLDTMNLLRGVKCKRRYTQEEDEFINTELKTHQGNKHGDIRWAEIEKKHDEKREGGYRGFSKKRTAESLRSHFRLDMASKGLVHEDVKKRFPDYFTDERGESSHGRYSSEEQQLIIKMLDEHASMYNQKTWKLIEQVHNSKVEANAPGFYIARSAQALYQHFISLMKRKDIEVPGTVKVLYDEQINPYFTTDEQEFIITELLLRKGLLYSEQMWADIKMRHDRKRNSGCSGFTKKRTQNSLRSYFRRMIENDLVGEALKQKFPRYFQIKQDEDEQVEPETNESAESADDCEDALWDTTLQDLNELQQRPVEL